MARRRKTSAVDDIVALAALLPWWAGVVSAVMLYAVLHRLAVQPLAVMTQPLQMQSMLFGSLARALAMIGQYVLPLLFLAGAATSAWKRRERRALASTVTASKSTSAVDDMTWQQFEMLVGEAFRKQGYAVAETGGGGPDGGVDLRLTKNREKYLVQCKHWKAFTVGVDVVRELYGVMAAKGAAGGFVVTSGRFTQEATKFADGRNITLVDGPKLHGMLGQGSALREPVPQILRPEASAAKPAPVAAAATVEDRSEPVLRMTCPLCSNPMVERVAKRGANAGTKFLGCMKYPACRGTRKLG